MRSGGFPFQIHRRSDRVRVLLAAAVRAGTAAAGGGVIEGFVTTQSGTIRLGGAQVVAPQLLESGSRVGALGRRRPFPLHRAPGRQVHADRVARRLRRRARGGGRRGRSDDGAVARPAAGDADADRRSDGADLDRVGGRHARLVRVDQQPRDRRIRQRQRARRRAASARERHRSAGRRQHQRRTADAGRRPDRRQHAHRSGARPRALHAARRRDRFGGGDAESVRGRVRALLVRPGGDPDAPRRRRLARAASTT